MKTIVTTYNNRLAGRVDVPQGTAIVEDNQEPEYLDGIEAQYSVQIFDGDNEGWHTVAYCFDLKTAKLCADAINASKRTKVHRAKYYRPIGFGSHIYAMGFENYAPAEPFQEIPRRTVPQHVLEALADRKTDDPTGKLFFYSDTK